MKNMKQIIATTLIIVLSFGLVGCSASAEPKEAVAVVNGTNVPRSLYSAYLWSAQQFFEMLSGPTIWDMELEGQSTENIAKERALESAVLAVVATQKANELGLKLEQSQIDEIEEAASTFMQINGAIAELHQFEQDDIVDLLTAAELSIAVQTKLGESYMPAEADITAYIDANKSNYETVTARHILIGTKDDFGMDLTDDLKAEKRAVAQELLDRIQNGETVGDLAAEYSEDPGSAFNKGEYTFGRNEMVKEFETAAFDGVAGEVWPELVETVFGYHIIETIAHSSADETAMREEFINQSRVMFATNEIEELIMTAEVETLPSYDEVRVVRSVYADLGDMTGQEIIGGEE
ncbi:MAG: hypothetical protein ATN36_02990 [Epulopiscium sp. Nele67-Bin005]|nr:MAG: hypothetical protein ATN36_02990 [Epulopiscium sp. Nele67-Bin005]